MGELADAAMERAAVAISRGGAPKTYAYTDPNEDAALCAVGASGLLVAVADGHSGHEASENALLHLLETNAAAWTEGKGHDAHAWFQHVLMALVEINDVVLDLQRDGRGARTTLSLGVARPEQDQLVTASIGDSHLFRVDDTGARDLAPPRARGGPFLGSKRLTPSELERRAHIDVLPLAETRAIAAVTDGLSERRIGLADPAAAVAEAARSAEAASPGQRAPVLARDVVERALEAHRRNDSGDNVAAAVAWLGD